MEYYCKSLKKNRKNLTVKVHELEKQTSVNYDKNHSLLGCFKGNFNHIVTIVSKVILKIYNKYNKISTTLIYINFKDFWEALI